MEYTQTEAILKFLRSGALLTPLEALQRFGCFRLAARIHEIRQAGYQVESHCLITENGKRVAAYALRAPH